MTIKNRLLLLSSWPLLLLIGCSPHIPQLEHPGEIERIYSASFDRTWEIALEVVKISKGITIVQDKSSGLIVYSIFPPNLKNPIFINLYLKHCPEINSTVVYLFAKDRWGTVFIEVERSFFKKMDIFLKG